METAPATEAVVSVIYLHVKPWLQLQQKFNLQLKTGKSKLELPHLQLN
jgi:hypothetical protein